LATALVRPPLPSLLHGIGDAEREHIAPEASRCDHLGAKLRWWEPSAPNWVRPVP
jgi:hypothetical protein